MRYDMRGMSYARTLPPDDHENDHENELGLRTCAIQTRRTGHEHPRPVWYQNEGEEEGAMEAQYDGLGRWTTWWDLGTISWS